MRPPQKVAAGLNEPTTRNPSSPAAWFVTCNYEFEVILKKKGEKENLGCEKVQVKLRNNIAKLEFRNKLRAYNLARLLLPFLASLTKSNFLLSRCLSLSKNWTVNAFRDDKINAFVIKPTLIK